MILSQGLPLLCVPQVMDSLLKRAADFGIVLEDIAITHLSFSTEVLSGASDQLSLHRIAVL